MIVIRWRFFFYLRVCCQREQLKLPINPIIRHVTLEIRISRVGVATAHALPRGRLHFFYIRGGVGIPELPSNVTQTNYTWQTIPWPVLCVRTCTDRSIIGDTCAAHHGVIPPAEEQNEQRLAYL